jgi:hypothetical protein
MATICLRRAPGRPARAILAAEFARNLERAARGEALPAQPSLWAMLTQMIRGWFGR